MYRTLYQVFIYGFVVILIQGQLFASDVGDDRKGYRPVKSSDNNDKGFIQGVDVTRNPRRSPSDDFTDRARLEMNTVANSEQYKETQIRRNQRKKILNEVFDISILMQPTKRIIRPVDMIGISPAYITQIVFPETMKITDVISSFNASVLKHSKNLLWIRPNSNTFFSGNIILTLTDGNKNYSMTIFAERYFQKDCTISDGGYLCKKRNITSAAESSYSLNNLSTLYVYTNPQKIDDMKAIIMYEKLVRRQLDIKEQGDRVSFNYKGLGYSIVRDDMSGSIFYRGKRYRVEIGS
ncbi:MAG: Unknown protein [uncultured Sulfurovum sp.]|uniref:Uncharacterized protein n=1 Tax=uncultured Sulfurovum sp. TaxID=269237 RepID=A0A6S6SL25_9BACT|nr:MAG: Unknown protein [uncultured Sulfurovum sp.]